VCTGSQKFKVFNEPVSIALLVLLITRMLLLRRKEFPREGKTEPRRGLVLLLALGYGGGEGRGRSRCVHLGVVSIYHSPFLLPSSTTKSSSNIA
jgi:hypothetical protein